MPSVWTLQKTAISLEVAVKTTKQLYPNDVETCEGVQYLLGWIEALHARIEKEVNNQ